MSAESDIATSCNQVIGRTQEVIAAGQIDGFKQFKIYSLSKTESTNGSSAQR